MLEDALTECVKLGDDEFGSEETTNAGKILRMLWEKAGTKAFVEWIRRVVVLVQQKKILLCELCEQDDRGGEIERSGKITENEPATCEKNSASCPMRYLWELGIHGSASQRQEPDEQFARKLNTFMQKLSCEAAPCQTLMRCLRIACKGSRAMREALASVEEEHPARMGHRVYIQHQESDERSKYVQPQTNYLCYALQGNGIDRADTAGCNGCGWRVDKCYTLNTIDRPAVCFANRPFNAGDTSAVVKTLCAAETSKQPGVTVCYDCRGNGNGQTAATLTGDHENRVTDYTNCVVFYMQAIGQYGDGKTSSTVKQRDYKDATDLVVQKKQRKYIVRRITPLECCRLQGFPDWWTDGVEGSDSAQYKMWGNGMALPNMLHVMRGIAVSNRNRAADKHIDPHSVCPCD